MMMTGIGMGLGGIGLILMLLFWGSLIFGGVWLVRTIFANNQQKEPKAGSMKRVTPRETLDQRYARGEINREEYETIKSDLI